MGGWPPRSNFLSNTLGDIFAYQESADKMVEHDKFLFGLFVGNELTVLKIGGDNASIVFLNIICDDNNAQNEEKFPAWKMDLEKSTMTLE